MNPASAMITFSYLQRIKEMVIRKPVFPFPLLFLKPPATQVKVPKKQEEPGAVPRARKRDSGGLAFSSLVPRMMKLSLCRCPGPAGSRVPLGGLAHVSPPVSRAPFRLRQRRNQSLPQFPKSASGIWWSRGGQGVTWLLE